MKCPLCNSRAVQPVPDPRAAGGRASVVIQPVFGVPVLGCDDCGFVFADYIHPEVVELFYRNFCRGELSEDTHRDQFDRYDEAANSRIQFLAPHLSAPIARALDYGGGSGATAKRLTEFADEVLISELDPNITGFIEVGERLRMIAEDDLGKPESAGAFDLIVLSNVLEHMTGPLRQLARFSRLCRKDGLFFIEIPNEAQVLRATGLMAQQHVVFFSPETFRQAVEKQGSFDIVDFNLSGPRAEEIIEARKLVHRHDAMETENGWVMRALLRNARPVDAAPSEALSMAEANEILVSLGRTAMQLVER